MATTKPVIKAPVKKKVPILGEIYGDEHGPFIVFSKHVFRPQPSTTAHGTAPIFNKERSVCGATARKIGESREVLPVVNTRNGSVEYYLLVYDKDLRELWAGHGTMLRISSSTPWDPYIPSRDQPQPTETPSTIGSLWGGGKWKHSLAYAMILYGKATKK